MESHEADWMPALRMYRGMFLVILFVFLLGVNTYGWRSSGVNHVLIFELDPRHHLAHQEFMEVTLSCSTISANPFEMCYMGATYFLTALEAVR